MKLYKTLGLATAGIAWLATSTSVFAQRVTTNPNAVPNTISTPTFSPDTLRPSREQMMNDNTAGRDDADRKNKRDRKRTMRRNNRSDENSRMNRSGSTSTDSSTSSSQSTNRQDGAYRQGSVSNGTTNNNSNTTNYNSNNVMTAPTGVGSNPTATGAVGDISAGTTGAGTTTSGNTAPSGATTPNISQPAATGTGEAVSGAPNAPITNLSASSRSTTIGDFVAAQPDYSTLQNTLQAVNLDKTFREGQAYTIFAPSNAAFKKLPTTTQNVLLEGSNRESLKKLLTYHLVQGTVDGKELTKQINAGNGTARLKTLNGGVLTAKMGTDNKVLITDEQGNTAQIDTPDQIQNNGVVHGIDKVLMPKLNSVTFR